MCLNFFEAGHERVESPAVDAVEADADAESILLPRSLSFLSYSSLKFAMSSLTWIMSLVSFVRWSESRFDVADCCSMKLSILPITELLLASNMPFSTSRSSAENGIAARGGTRMLKAPTSQTQRGGQWTMRSRIRLDPEPKCVRT